MNFKNLTDFLDTLPEKGIPGGDCAVYYKHRPVFRHTVGYSDIKSKAPLREDSLYNFYSMSKVITCTAALQLYEKGKYLLSDPVSEYLPEFKEMQVQSADESGKTVLKPAQNAITVQDLFTMCAGLTYNMETDAIKEVHEKTGGKCPTRETVKAFAKEPLLFEPGTHWNYSLCHDVLGALIEVLSGERFGEYLQKNIFLPLGMKDTGFVLTEEKARRMASQYLRHVDTGELEDVGTGCGYKLGTEFESGGAGMITSLDDYMRFAECLCRGGMTPDGENLISRRTIDLMRTNHLNEACMKDFNWLQMVGYGYGLGVRTMVDKVKGGCNGALGEFAWGGLAGSFGLIDPENELTIVYAQHMINNLETYVHPRIRNITYACLDK